MVGKIHYYTSDTSARRLIHVYLAIGGVLLAYLLGISNLPIPWWFDAPASIGFYGMLYQWFRRKLWKVDFIRKITGIKTPDWNGVYKGELTSSFDKFGKKHSIEIEIEQTWDTIAVCMKADSSQSSSISASFSISQNTIASLVYEYINRPLADATDTMHIHHGMTTMYLKDDKLHGEFFSGRGRNNYGKFITEKQT